MKDVMSLTNLGRNIRIRNKIRLEKKSFNFDCSDHFHFGFIAIHRKVRILVEYFKISPQINEAIGFEARWNFGFEYLWIS